MINNNTHIQNNNDGIYANNDITYNNPFKYSTSIDNNDVSIDIYEFDTDCDCYNDHNNNININIITGDYDNYDKDNNNHVDRYDVGIAQDDHLVANDREENNYATNLVPCVLSTLGTTSIVYDCDPVGANDHYVIQCNNTSPTISSMSSFTSLTIPLNLSSLKTSSSSNRDTCVGCNSHNGKDTDLDLVPVHVRPITSFYILLAPSSMKPTFLSRNLYCFSSDCGLICLGYVPDALVPSLSSIFSSLSV